MYIVHASVLTSSQSTIAIYFLAYNYVVLGSGEIGNVKLNSKALAIATHHYLAQIKAILGVMAHGAVWHS